MRRRVLLIAIVTVFFSVMGMTSVVVLNLLPSSRSVIYFVRGETGGIEVRRDLLIEDADRLLFMLDLSGVLSRIKHAVAIARHRSSLELSWDDDEGVGSIKQFRLDGSTIALSFSRYRDDSGTPKGLFLGGELPYGDDGRSDNMNSSGFGFFDGSKWYHIWCSSNEGLSLTGRDAAVVPALWEYKGSRILENTDEEVILESRHEAVLDGVRIKMTRHVAFRSTDDYFILKVRFTNMSTGSVAYNYAYGDEPWIGDYHSSRGDVGWYEGGTVKYEKFLSPTQHSYAGFWDLGNEDAGERGGEFTGKANFIEWLSPTPSYVFFGNSFEDCCSETSPLEHETSRVVDVVWLNQLLRPGESREHTLAIGMATPSAEVASLPVKPTVVP